MVPVRFFILVERVDPEVIYRVHLGIVALPIKAFTTAGNGDSRSWGFSFKGDRKMAIEILKKKDLAFKLF